MTERRYSSKRTRTWLPFWGHLAAIFRTESEGDPAKRALAIGLSLIMVTSVLGSGAALITTSTAQAAPGDDVYRVNAGGNTVTSTDGGADWTPPGSTAGVSLSGGSTYSNNGASISLDGSVPSGTPTGVFQSEIYGDQQWTFSDSIQSGQQYEVRLYFAEIFHVEGHADDAGAAGQTGDRVFDVAVEGQQVLDDYDIYADVGAETGVMKSYTVTPEDGSIDVDLTTEVDNAKISAIEIVEAEPQPNELGGPSSVDFGSVVTGESATETVTVTNLGGDGDPSIDISDVSITGSDAGEFSAGSASQTTLAPGESADVSVTFTPSDAQSKAATLGISHSGTNSPMEIGLSGEGTSTAQVSFGKSSLQGFSQGSLTALEFGPDDRLYVAKQDGMVYALEITRNGENSYSVDSQEAIDAIQDIPNHDDDGTYNAGEDDRQITGLTVGGTASQPVVYVSSSDPTIKVGDDDDSVDTNSGAISRLTFDWSSDGSLANVDHDAMVLGLPRSEENHATNGLDLSDDGNTLYVAQGGHTNQGAPSNNFGHTPEYALSGAVLSVDLQQINDNYQEKNLQEYDGGYPNVDFLYGIPTIQNDDGTDGDDLPFGGNDGVNQAKWVADGPVQVHSSGYRNPYDLVLSEDDQLYAIDNGPNGGWGGQPINEGPAGECTNEPNDPGSGTGDQLHLATEGSYGGHPAPIRANPTGADIYDAEGNVVLDITESNSPVPSSMVNPVECDYQDPSEDNSLGSPFGWTGGMDEYTASNFGGQMQGDLLVVVGSSSVERVELTADGDGVTNQEGNFFSDVSALGIAAQGDDGPFPGTVWTARGGITVFEPSDYDSDGSGGDTCTGADDPSLDEDGDGYDNADEIDAGTNPCSAASTPADFDGDGTSNLNDADDDDDGQPDTSDPFAVDPDDGTTTSLPVQMDFSETQLFGDEGQGWTGLMTNGQDDYQDLYDPDQMTVGGAAQVLTVESVPQGDAHAGTNTQQYAFQRGIDAPDQPFTVSTTVNGLPESPQNFQSLGLYVGNGDQDNYVKLVSAANGGTGGIEFAKEVDGTFTHPGPDMVDDSSVTGPATNTDLSLTVDPTTDPAPDNGVDEVAVTAAYAVDGGQQTEVGTGAMPASWLDSSDGTGLAVGVISTSNGASSTFDATWTHLNVEYVSPPENQPPTADAGADITVDEGQQVTLDASGSTDPDGDTLGYTWTQTAGSPDGLLDMSDSEQVSFTAPQVDGDTTLTFQVEVADGNGGSDTDTVDVTVQDTDTGGTPSDGEVVHRVNTGGSEIAASDGPAWSTDTSSAPSQYLVAGGATSGGYSVGSVDSSVPDGTPTELFQTERYDAPSDPEMQWEFPTEEGATYEVRLYFHDGYTGTSAVGDRVFNVSIEDEQVLTNFDIIEEYGDNTAAMESFTVESDGTIDVDFGHGTENPQINAIEIVQVDDGSDTMTVAEAVASYGDGDDSQIEFQEIQTAINWWQTDAEVPNTGGETIDFQQIQQLINLWQTDATIGDGGGSDTTGSALVEITPDSGNVDQSTYGSGTYQVTNTGEKEIASVSFDLSTASFPDMVFDPQGTAGDPTGEGLNIASDGGTGITTAEGGSEAFSQPHNGQNADDGYDVMTVEFDDFQNGETATFWADNDPTSVKGATVGSQEAGPVSGLELARSTVTVTYEDGTTQTTQLMGDGSVGGSTATVTADEAPAPTIGAGSVSLDDSILDARHSGATVSQASQTITVTGQPGETVTLVRAEGELSLSNVPDADGDGQPGYEIEELEANNAVNVEYYTATLDSNGEAAIPVTLTDSADDSDEAGFNYFTAVHGEASGDMGLASNVVVLKYDASDDGTGSADFAVTENGGIDASTYNGGSFEITNTGDQQISSVTYDLSSATFPDVVFDPEGTAGDTGSKGFTPDSGGSTTGLQGGSFAAPHNGQDSSDGYDELTATFDDFQNGESFAFSVDIDPTSIKNAQGTGAAGSVSGLETSGATVTVEYADGSTQTTQLFGDGSDGGAQATAKADVASAPTLGVDGVSLDSSALDAQHGAATVAEAGQTITVSGPADATVELLHVEGQLELANQANGYDLEEYEANTAENVDYQTVDLGGDGEATVDVTLTNTSSSGVEGGFNHFVATVQDGSGDTGATSNVVVLKYDESSATSPEPQVLHRVNAGESATVSATDDGPDWTGVENTGSQYLASVGPNGGTYCGGDAITPDGTVPSSTPDAVFNCERYGNMTWEFSVDSGQEVDVRLYLGNSYPGANEPGQRQFNVSIEGQQVLTNYDPVADVGHATGTMKSFTVTDDGDGTITVTFDQGAAENPEVRALEIVETEGSSSQ